MSNIFQRLNTEQKNAVEELEQHILLLAPAGTGKTDTLSCRVVNIIQKSRALPEEILCLTFTNKACREMKARITEHMQDASLGERVPVKTFHGFCYDIIKCEAKAHTDLFADFTIADETDCQSILQELTEKAWPAYALQNLVSSLKEAAAAYVYQGRLSAPDSGSVLPDFGHAKEPEALTGFYQKALAVMLKEQPEKIKKHTAEQYNFSPAFYDWWRQNGARLTAAYDSKLHDLHALDFTDLITQAGKLLFQPAIGAKWTDRFTYINIDEVQDTSELEYDIVSRIFGKSRLLLCGDYFQTIYEWRGSKPEAILRKYQEAYHPRLIKLLENYRSTKTLLNASFDCLEQLFPERVSALYPDGMESVSSEQGEPVELKGALDVAEEAQWIYYRIQKLALEDYRQVCILTRSNKYNKQLSDYFRSLNCQQPLEERLPFMLIDEMKFFRRQEIKDVLAFLKLILNNHDASSLIRLLNRFGKGIGPATIKTIGADAVRSTGLKLTDFLDTDARNTGDPFAILLEALAAGKVVVFDVESTGVDPTREEIIQIAGIRLAPDGSIAEEFKRNLKPTKSVGQSVRVHGLTDAWLATHGEDAKQALLDFSAFARGAVLVGHNVTYDLSITSSHLSRLGLPQLSYRSWYDTLDIFRRFYPNLPNHKLEFLGEYCRVSHKSSHDAMDDILATAEILYYAIENNIRPQTEARRTYFAKWQDLFHGLALQFREFKEEAPCIRPWKLIGEIVVRAGIKDYYEKKKEYQRIQNLRELYSQAQMLDDTSLQPLDAIERFLHYTTLSNTELDVLTRKPQIPIITIHQAKGCEFDYVFLAGLQEGTFPNFQAGQSGRTDEEARLFYVAITRAKKQLFLSWSQQFYNHYREMSRFIKSIPRKYLRNA